MRTWLWKYRLPLALLALAPTYFAWQLAELRWGIPAQARADAIRNFNKGIYVLQHHGLSLGPHSEYKRLLREKYKVIDLSAACMQYLPDAIYEDNYNEQLHALLLRAHGKDIFEECRKAATETE